MKGRIDLRFFLPNYSKVRTRIEEVPEDFVAKVRSALAESVAEVCEEQSMSIKAKMITKLDAGLLAKKEHKLALTSLSTDFFFAQFAVGPTAAAIRFGGAADVTDPEEATGNSPEAE